MLEVKKSFSTTIEPKMFCFLKNLAVKLNSVVLCCSDGTPTAKKKKLYYGRKI